MASGYQGMIVEHALRHVRVSDIMTRAPMTLAPELPVGEAIEQYFLRFGYGGFPVVSDERVLGLLSLSQVRHCKARRASAQGGAGHNACARAGP